MLEPIKNDLRFRIEIEHYMMTDNKPAVKKLIIKGVTIFGDSSVRNEN